MNSGFFKSDLPAAIEENALAAPASASQWGSITNSSICDLQHSQFAI